MAVNLLAGMQYMQQQGEQGKQQGLEQRYNRLAGEAFNAPDNQTRDSAIGQIAVNNPTAATELRTQYQQQDNDQLKLLTGAARYLKGAMDTKNVQAVQGAWNTVLPGLIRRGVVKEGELSPTWDPSYEATVHQLLAMGDGQGGAGEAQQFTLSPGSKRFDASGNVIAEVPFAPASGTIVTVPDGMGGEMQMVWDPRTRQLSDLPPVGGQAYEDGSPVSVTSGTGPDGTAFRFDPNMSAEDRELAMADVANGGALTSATMPPRDVTPQQFARRGRLGYTPPEQKEQYTTLSAQEVAGLGLPEGTIAQRGPTGQVQIINKPRDLPTGGQVIDNGDGTTTYIPAGKISEGERNASGFYQRMIAANAEMARLEAAGYDPTNRRDYYTAGGEYLNPLATTEGQQYRQAQDNWLRANLRKESGAAIGVAEMDQERKNYFPIPGDSKETIAQKARNRTTTERAMRAAAGGGLPAAEGQPAPQQGALPQIGGWSIQRVE